MQEKIIKITDAVYNILEFFPSDEPLKKRIKEKALSIMENSVSNNEAFLNDIDVILNFLKISRSVGWISVMNYLIIKKEYEEIKNNVKPLTVLNKPEQEKTVKIVKKEPFDLSQRQKKILEILSEKGKAQVADLKAVLTNVTKRTIRRDLDDLLKKSVVERVGEWNQVFYKMSER